MNWLIPAIVGLIGWAILMWIIWKARKEGERLSERKDK